MIIIRDYKVTPDGKWLIIDAVANPNCEGVYISGLKISTDGSYSSDKDKYYEYFNNSDSGAIKDAMDEAGVSFDDKPVELRLNVSIDGINTPFYMTIIGTDPYSKCTTCAYKSAREVVTFNKYPMYKALACTANQIDSCETPQLFVDFLMRLKALEASIVIGDTDSINKYHKWFVLHSSTAMPGVVTPTHIFNTCGCK